MIFHIDKEIGPDKDVKINGNLVGFCLHVFSKAA